jgi:hypothetical protein
MILTPLPHSFGGTAESRKTGSFKQIAVNLLGTILQRLHGHFSPG